MEENLKELRDSLVKYIDEAISKAQSNSTANKIWGNWYKSRNGSIVFFTGDTSGFGINIHGEWSHSTAWISFTDDLWSLATDNEVEYMLIEEAKKRGYEKGNFKCVDGCFEITPSIHFCYSITKNGLHIGGKWCFMNGKWAIKISVEEKLPYNKWYKSNTGGIVFFTDESQGYGINSKGQWKDYTILIEHSSYRWVNLNSGVWTPATDEEVEDMFIKETEKRGYKKGVYLIFPWSLTRSVQKSCTGSVIKYSGGISNIRFEYLGANVFWDGVWAEIIREEEEIEIGGKIIYFYLKNLPKHILIDNKKYFLEDVEAAKTVLRWGGKIKVGCSHQFDLDLETVEKILKKLY